MKGRPDLNPDPDLDPKLTTKPDPVKNNLEPTTLGLPANRREAKKIRQVGTGNYRNYLHKVSPVNFWAVSLMKKKWPTLTCSSTISCPNLVRYRLCNQII